LIQQRLKDVVVAPIDEKNICIAVLECSHRCHPAKPAAHDDDAWT
jgi:hypothetical protein